MSRRIARPYATALFEVVKRQGLDALRAAEHELAVGAAVLAAEPELVRVLEVPAVPLTKKRELVALLARELGARPETSRLLAVMAEHIRLRLLPEVVAALRELNDRREGLVRGRVEVPVALTASQTQALSAALTRVLASRVELETAVRPDLLAGFVVRVGSQVFDGSLAAQLRRFAAEAAARS
jgi:F-type H+-transporting ATPase subunit delta